MHETTADRSRSRVEILVTTPHGKIDLPVVQTQLDVAGGVGQIKGEYAALPPSCFRQTRNVEILAGQEIHAAQQYHGDLATALDQHCLDVLAPPFDQQQSLTRLKAVMAQLR